MTLSQTNFESMDVPIAHTDASPSPVSSSSARHPSSHADSHPRPVAYTSLTPPPVSAPRAESHLNRVRDSHTEQLRNIAFYTDVAIMMLRERYAL
jgi:hypothetical protein